MSSVDNNVNSYDIGAKPFRHDPDRGKWKSITDFYLGCIGHAFNIKCFTVLPFFIQFHGGVFFLIPFIIGLFLFSLPIFIFQSFLGQFSSTGFISVFRISPLFKGIGYVILVLNIASACYYSVLIAYPLTYFFASFDPSLPWMSCNNTFNTENCIIVSEGSQNETDYNYNSNSSWSTAEYFHYAIVNYDANDVKYVAWPILLSTILVWIIMAGIFYKGFQAINLAIRFCASVSLILFGIFFVRMICLPGALNGIIQFFTPQIDSFRYFDTFFSAPFITVFIFGSGWGTILTMASYNPFKTDIICYSQVIGFVIMILFIFTVMTSFIVEEYLYDYLSFYHYSREDYIVEFLVIGFPYLFGHMEASNMWSLIFFGMIFLCELCGLIIQVLSICTALLDEYENLRAEKHRTYLLVITCIGLTSLIFTTNTDMYMFDLFESFCGLAQMGICFLELIVVVWFYGRQRFQRDIEFMLGRKFATWKFFVIRFITPLFTLILILIYLVFSLGGLFYLRLTLFDTILILIVKVFPWLCIPAYIGVKLANTTGTIYHRVKKSLWPTDWYPVEPIYRQRYEESLGSSDISHQLVVMKAEEEEYY